MITYAKNVFIPLSNACRNSCGYCGFRSSSPYILRREDVEEIIKKGRAYGCKEALFTLGERPESNAGIRETLSKWGYGSTVEYLYDLCVIALDEGLLPHCNPGIVSKNELEMLREVSASVGLMLENSSERLCEKGMPHEKSPGKAPRLRIKMIKDAGRLRIPFTTGLLIGIGESRDELIDSLDVIAKLNRRYEHIQEIIIQNFRPKKNTPMEKWKEPPTCKMVEAVKEARKIMPTTGIQVPPNLNRHTWPVLISAGANDLGGVSPVTKDYINPEDRWPGIDELKLGAEAIGLTIRERLPVYPEFIKKGWYPETAAKLIRLYTDKDGLVKEPFNV